MLDGRAKEMVKDLADKADVNEKKRRAIVEAKK